MSCVSLPHIGLPSLGLSFPVPAIPSIALGATIPCCNIPVSLVVDMTLVNQAIASVFSTAAAALAVLMAPIMAGLQIIINAMNKLLDKITFDCPLE